MVAVPSRGRADLQAHAPEADATRALYEQYARQIYAYCFSKLRSREEAEDAVQSTFLNAFRALQRDVAPAHEAAWLYKIAENVCLTRARSSVRRRRIESPGDLEAISEVVPAHEPETEELANLPQALESMPEQQRRALLLREWQGLSYREIADEMELSQAAVETLLFRARRTLAAGLTTEEPKKRGKLARLRAGGDAGAVFALLKTVLFSGGAKVVIAGAVAATGVVGISPGARHTIDDLFVPHMTAAKPAVHRVVTPKPVVAPVAAPVVVQRATPVAPVQKAHRAKHPVAVFHPRARHLGRFGKTDQPLRPPAAPVVAPTATASAPTPLEPTQPQPAVDQQPSQSQGHGKGKSADKPKHQTESAQPTPAPAAPADQPATPQPAATQPSGQPGENANDGGNGNGHAYGRDGHSAH